MLLSVRRGGRAAAQRTPDCRREVPAWVTLFLSKIVSLGPDAILGNATQNKPGKHTASGQHNNKHFHQ